MLRANVGLSRKISRDYNSTGYSVNLDGEIPISIDDPGSITEKIRELFSLAQEALAQEIDRDQGEDAIGRRDEERLARRPEINEQSNGHSDRSLKNPVYQSTATNGRGTQTSPTRDENLATEKQLNFLLTMGKRFKLSRPQLESRVAEIVGRSCGVDDLTKKEACLVLDHFTKATKETSNGRSL